MTKILTIAQREFTHNLRRPAFLFAVFGTPAIVAVALMVVILLAGNPPALEDYGLVGYIDNSAEQVLSRGLPPDGYADVFVPAESAASAETAARAGELAAYFELPTDYLQTGRVVLSTIKPPTEELFDAIDAMLRANLTAGTANAVAVDILANGGDFQVTVLDTNRTFGEDGAFIVVMLPVVFGFLLILSSVISSSFLMAGLVEEKTNRIMEVLITSVRPIELLVGKLLGMGLLGLLQVLTILAVGYFGLFVAQRSEVLTGLSIPVDLVVLSIVYFLLAYFFMAAVGIAIGAVVGSEQEARQLSAIFVLPVMLPYLLLITFMIDPNGTVPTVLSLIPFTAPMAIVMRSGMTAVPLWQIAVSIGGLLLLNVIVMLVSARLFRWGILNTNKMPNPRRLLQVLRGRTPETVVQPRRQEGA